MEKDLEERKKKELQFVKFRVNMSTLAVKNPINICHKPIYLARMDGSSIPFGSSSAVLTPSKRDHDPHPAMLWARMAVSISVAGKRSVITHSWVSPSVLITLKSS